jgi:hypothetical protein
MSMPQAKANSLFVNFHGPESIAGPEFVNTGLRFPILKAIVNNMGGDIWIESEIGKGKTFIISMAKEQGASVSRPTDAAFDAKPAGIKPIASMKVNQADAGPAQNSGGIKIQRNTPSAGTEAGNEGPLPTVSDLLNFDVPMMDRKIEMPGKDVKVPEAFLKKGPAQAPAAPKKNEPIMQLPDELPPLPELEDDKGSDIIK